MFFSCKVTLESAEGCTPVSTSLDLHTNVDTETELARLHSLTITHMERLEKVMRKYIFLGMRNLFIKD